MTHSVSANIFSKMTQALTSVSAQSIRAASAGVSASLAPAIGDKFLQIREGSAIWIVKDILTVRASDIPLVSLFSEKHPGLSKILSATALLDEDAFKKLH